MSTGGIQKQVIWVLLIELSSNKTNHSPTHTYTQDQTHTMERRIKHFISLIEFEGEIFYINEDLSSKIAQEKLFALERKEREKKIKSGELDSLAAVEILERFLAQTPPHFKH